MSQFVKYLQKNLVNASTVVELLRYRSVEQGKDEAFTFLQEVGVPQATLTYADLDRQSRAIAAQLQSLGLAGERALLLYPPGIEYLSAFFGCLYAGVVAVPAYPPRNARNTPRILAILNDAQAAIILTTTAIKSQLKTLLADHIDIHQIHWLTTDHLIPGLENTWQEPILNPDTLAFLQYTSGSTGTPKGVMLTHGNLLHNAAVTVQYMEHSPSSKFVTWLPIYHDMGLIGGVLQPLSGGFPCLMMPPAAFLQRPYRWLQAISHYQGTTSGAPNFAYDLCVEKITPEQRATLDLSSWDVAFNGAEPIRPETLARFAATFAECGFRPEAFYPCYGMAEATLMVSGSVKAALPTQKTIQKIGLEQNQVLEATDAEDAVTLVGCGVSVPQQQIVIAHPDTLTRCKEGEVGEIWVSGPSIGQGYWNRPTETEQTFQAVLQDTGEGPFLRTGDLGFLEKGEVFVTGRAKDLIIIRGRNLYPQDLELTAMNSDPSLRVGGSAAFCIEIEQQEQIVIVQELEFRAKPNLEEVTTAIRQAIAQEHEVQVYAIILIKPGTILKTSSGKIQRRATKAAFLAGELDVVNHSILETDIVTEPQNERLLNRSILLSLTPTESQSRLEDYFRCQVSKVVKISPEKFEINQPISSLGLDSLKVFELKNRLERDLEVEIEVADFFEDLSLQGLATKISSEITAGNQQFVALNKIQRTAEFYPLSFSQQGLWFIHQLAPNTAAYNIPIIIDLKGKLNIAALTQSLHEIIQRHEVLRTKFIFVEQQPVQVIEPTVAFNLPIEDLRLLSKEEAAKTQEKLTQTLAQHRFNLSEPPLLKALLLQLKEEEYQLLITVHHIIADGWSIGVFIRELALFYQEFAAGKQASLPELPIQPVDYAIWQKQCFNAERLQTLLSYWKQQLSGELPVLNLPFDRARSPIQTYNGNRAKFVISNSLTQDLKTLSDQEGATLFMTLLAAFKTLLYRYTGQTDILVGSPVANRNAVEIESLIGLFVNVLVLRTNLSENLTFRTLLSQVKSTALAAYSHQDLPFDQLVQELQPQRDLSYNPLFQVMFALQNVPISTPELSDLSLTFKEGNNSTSKFDLSLFLEETHQGLIATVEYNTDLFNSATIDRMFGHFQILLEGIIENSDTKISALPLLTEAEKHQLFIEWNQTQKDYPETTCIHQLIEAQVEKTPDAVAVVFGTEQLTYQQLNTKASQLADFLQQLGVKPESLVGVCLERSPDLLIALLGILKAGGAYVPLDPTYPSERLAFMVEDAHLGFIITQTTLMQGQLAFQAALPHQPPKVICLDTLGDQLAQQKTENLESGITPNNLAYVIYTSGSTGKPKGVQITHQAVVNFLTSMRYEPGLTAEDTLVAVTTISFDIAVLELYLPLMVGGRIVLASRDVARDAVALIELLNNSGATVMQATPSTWRMLLDAGWVGNKQLKALCGGESLSGELADSLLEKTGSLWNLYGPTEATVWATCGQIKPGEERICIGKPIANTQVYILDQQLQPVPVGVAGELHIGGAGLARGYLNRPELTAERFLSRMLTDDTDDTDVVDGLTCESRRLRMLTDDADVVDGLTSESRRLRMLTDDTDDRDWVDGGTCESRRLRMLTDDRDWVDGLTCESRRLRMLTDDRDWVDGLTSDSRLYKTGDLARYLPDGRIECLGRIDHQVKLRGFRIELGEIEAVLRQYSTIQDVVVVAREDIPRNYQLVAYLVPASEAKFTISELRDYLKDKLPDYMIPSAFVELEVLPLTPNGKVDRLRLGEAHRKALPVPEKQRLDLKTSYEAPQSELETAIAQIWRDILQLEKVGIQDNFFDLGGNSLLMVQVNHKLREILNREISVIEMFQHPTIKSLAQYLKPKPKEISSITSLNNRVQRQIASLNRQKSLMKGNRLQ